MKNYIKSIFIVAILLLIQVVWTFSSAEKINPLELPKFHYFINDYSQILDQNSRNTLNQQAKSIQDSYGPQVVTVLFPHREGNELFDIAIKAFNKNWIWDKKKNDGLLLAIATEEKKIRIVVGYGLEEKIPDIIASQIIEKYIRPEVNKANFSQAIKNFYTQVETILWSNYTNFTTTEDTTNTDYEPYWVFLLVLTIILGTTLRKNKYIAKQRKKIGIISIIGWIACDALATPGPLIWVLLIILGVVFISNGRFGGWNFGRWRWWFWGFWWGGLWGFWWGGGFSWWGGSSWWGGAGD